MPSNPKNRFFFRSFQLIDFYKDKITSRSLLAKRDLETFANLLRNNYPEITERDKLKIFQHLNDARFSPDTIEHLQLSIISELIEEGEVDLAQKIKHWTTIEWIAIAHEYFD